MAIIDSTLISASARAIVLDNTSPQTVRLPHASIQVAVVHITYARRITATRLNLISCAHGAEEMNSEYHSKEEETLYYNCTA
ncbi:hypothetical protein M378DRAFT_161424 [Amanita muscaria Koide BX008]|uniref:Uncharacterized protein n=1 Tax=Amanita muscaria (strain Koide BX008) TaxID=946122 RepID=A0A0C2XA05_AMAMK|nr:hypothetical protein M378DRAFT_161424 [Amanita muscaria Koide BX008]